MTGGRQVGDAGQLNARLAAAALPAGEAGGERDIALGRLFAADHRVEHLERGLAELSDRLPDRGQLRVHVPGHRDVVETGDGYLPGDVHARPAQREHDAEGGLVVGAHDHPGQRGTRREQPLGDDRGARGVVVALPLRPGEEHRARRPHLGGEGLQPGVAVWAVGVAAEVADRGVAMVVEQVPGQRPRPGAVVAADVCRGRGLARYAGHRKDRDLPRDLVDLPRLEHPVVQDQPVAFARHREYPADGVVVGDVHRPQQQVEAAALGGPFDAPVEHVVELEGLGLVGEHVIPEQPGGVPGAARSGGHPRGGHRRAGRQRAAHDDADDFLDLDRQRAGGVVGDVAEFGDRPLHPVADVGARVAAGVEHPRHRGDGDAGRPRDVVDRRRRRCRHEWLASLVAADLVSAFPAALAVSRGSR